MSIQLIKKIISEKTGLDSDEITPEAYIGEDLNIGEFDLVEIITELEETLEIELKVEKEEIETIQDILDALSEEIE